MSAIQVARSEFGDLTGQILKGGHRVRFRASGSSMQPFIQNSDILEVAPLVKKRIKRGDVLLVQTTERKLLAHRVIKTGPRDGVFMYLLKSDVNSKPDGWFRLENILGRVEVVERDCRRIIFTSNTQQRRARMWITITPWLSKFSWLPEWIRKRIWHWLLIN